MSRRPKARWAGPRWRTRSAIRDPEGKPVRPGETGELTIKGIRGLSIFQEYDGDPAATAAAFDADGFFRTGDRVTLLDEGWIKFSDRASDVIKVGGEGVSPSEIEAVDPRRAGRARRRRRGRAG